MFRKPVIAAAVCAALSCSSGVTEPGVDLRAVQLELALPSATLSADDTASLVIRVRNGGDRALAFEYQSRCHVAVRIVDAVSRREVFAGDGGWQCGADLSGLAIPALGTYEHRLLLHAVSPMPGHLHGVHLAAGEYEVVAEVTAGGQRVESLATRFVAR